MRRFRNIIRALAVAMLLLPLSASLWAQEKDKPDYNFESVKNLDIFHSLYRELYLYYVDEIDPEKTIKTAIDKMLEGLDPYTVYILFIFWLILYRPAKLMLKVVVLKK